MSSAGLGRARIFLILGLALVVGCYVRFDLFRLNTGQAFVPWPDGVEYVATAQSIVDQGRFFLQLGPYEARSRYPPGFSLALALPLAFGVDATDLWRYKASFGTLLAGLLGVLVAQALARSGLAADIALAFGALAAIFWLLLPLNLAQANMILSDETALILTLVGLILLARALVSPDRRSWAIYAGLFFGAVVITRFAGLVLIAPAVALVVLAFWRDLGSRTILRVGAAVGLGAVPPFVLSAWLLARSGFPPFELTAYPFWVKEMFSSWEKTFNLGHAFVGNKLAPLPGGEMRPHARFSADVLFGLPGPITWETYGFFWPIAGWSIGLFLLWRHGRKDRKILLIGSAAFAIFLTHYVFFSLYACPGGRFYLPAIFLCTGLFFFGIGRMASHSNLARLLALLLVGIAAFGVTRSIQRDWRYFTDPPNTNATELEQFAVWRALGDVQRAKQPMGFEPLRVQALGRLDAATVSRIHHWGRLPYSEHVHRLRVFGQLNDQLELAPAADRRYIHESRLRATLRAEITRPERLKSDPEPLFHDSFENGTLGKWSMRRP